MANIDIICVWFQFGIKMWLKLLKKNTFKYCMHVVWLCVLYNACVCGWVSCLNFKWKSTSQHNNFPKKFSYKSINFYASCYRNYVLKIDIIDQIKIQIQQNNYRFIFYPKNKFLCLFNWNPRIKVKGLFDCVLE